MYSKISAYFGHCCNKTLTLTQPLGAKPTQLELPHRSIEKSLYFCIYRLIQYILQYTSEQVNLCLTLGAREGRRGRGIVALEWRAPPTRTWSEGGEAMEGRCCRVRVESPSDSHLERGRGGIVASEWRAPPTRA